MIIVCVVDCDSHGGSLKPIGEGLNDMEYKIPKMI